jgi:hypothetical protein
LISTFQRLSRQLRVRLAEDLSHDVAVGGMGFVGAAKFKGKATGCSDQDDLAGLKNKTLVPGCDANDLVIGNGDHRLFLDEDTLIIEDDPAIGDANETSAGTFAVVDSEKNFAFEQVGNDAVMLLLVIEIGGHIISIPFIA